MTPLDHRQKRKPLAPNVVPPVLCSKASRKSKFEEIIKDLDTPSVAALGAKPAAVLLLTLQAQQCHSKLLIAIAKCMFDFDSAQNCKELMGEELERRDKVQGSLAAAA
eukprot:1161788-Pelagomonas_calceolata.AAC.1